MENYRNFLSEKLKESLAVLLLLGAQELARKIWKTIGVSVLVQKI